MIYKTHVHDGQEVQVQDKQRDLRKKIEEVADGRSPFKTFEYCVFELTKYKNKRLAVIYVLTFVNKHVHETDQSSLDNLQHKHSSSSPFLR